MKVKVFVLLTILIMSCTKIDILTDQYWAASVLSDSELSLRGVNIVEIDAENRTDAGFSFNRKSGYILLSPLYSLQAEKISEEYPDKYIFCFGRDSSASRDDDRIIRITGMRSRFDIVELIGVIKKRIENRDFSDIDLGKSEG